MCWPETLKHKQTILILSYIGPYEWVVFLSVSYDVLIVPYLSHNSSKDIIYYNVL
jgi:hypothetical protein